MEKKCAHAENVRLQKIQRENEMATIRQHQADFTNEYKQIVNNRKEDQMASLVNVRGACFILPICFI